MQQSHEPKLGQLNFQLISPSRSLSPYVRSYWHFRSDAPLLTYQEEYMHPLGRFGIGFNFGDALLLDSQPLIDPVFLDGTNTISRRMSFIGQVELFGISFQEGGAFPIFGIPLVELQNTTSLLDALNRSDLLILHEKLRRAKSMPARIHLLEEWLLFRLLLGREHNQLVHASLNMLKMRNGRLSIPELAQEFSIGQRQLERLYQNQVGVSPKQYSKLLKVENARLALGRMDIDSSAELAVKLGFYDQPHFIREFSAVMGLTPHSYIKRKRSK